VDSESESEFDEESEVNESVEEVSWEELE